MSGPKPLATCWIQRHDLSVALDDVPVQTVDQVMHHYDGFDWAIEHALFRDGDARGAEVCPPGLGLVRESDREILHLMPNGRGRMNVSIPGLPQKRRWFHLFQAFGNMVEVSDVSDTLVRPAITNFLRGHDAALVSAMQGATS